MPRLREQTVCWSRASHPVRRKQRAAPNVRFFDAQRMLRAVEARQTRRADDATHRERAHAITRGLVSPALQQRIDALEVLLRAHAVGSVFGHLKLQTAGHTVDLLLGAATRIAPGVSTIDWRTAPLSEVFFAYGEGEDYEVDVGDRLVGGHVLEKNVIVWRSGELQRLVSSAGTAVRQPDGSWLESQEIIPRLEARPAAARRPFRSPLEVQLDPAQQAIVDLAPQAHTLILGEAGFGKTTVALHRLLALQRAAASRFRAAVIVPTEGLRRLTQLMLERKGVEDVEVWTYDRWALTSAQRAFPDLPRRESEGTRASVIAFKRHGAVAQLLAGFADEHPTPARDEDRPARSHARARRADLEHFFGDSAWMDRVVEASSGALSPRVVKEVTEHTRVQFLDPAEIEYAHVDRSALTAVDGRRLDEGTPTENAGTADIEDCAILFELARLRAVAHHSKPLSLAAYDCLLVDEAQEFAPLELRLLGRSLAPGGSVIVAGDAAQQVDPTSHFIGWNEVMEELGAAQHERAVLEVNYRCPPEVTALARKLIETAVADGPIEGAITRAHHDNACHLVLWLTEQLQRIESEDPSASIAVICRSEDGARSFARTLSHGLTLRLALEGAFDFRPGVTVTCVQEVKGLEFDCVVVPDAQADTYPITAQSRRSLYVAVTRATHHLGLAAAGSWTPLL
jgi:DNA helicase-2/ATP-dependent DNA helicase PcrA